MASDPTKELRSAWDDMIRSLERARDAIAHTAEAVREGRFEARPSSYVCRRCPYRQVCPSAVWG